MKVWYKLLLKSIIFVGIVYLCDFGIGHLFVYVKDKGLDIRPHDRWLKSSFAVEKVDADCIIIGSSTAEHNYISEEIEKNIRLHTYNCGQGGCFFLYSCCLINTIVDRYQPKLIIFDLDPKCLLDSDTRDEYQNMRYLSYYYDQDTVVKNYIQSKGEKTKWFYYFNSYRYNSHFVYTFYPIIHYSPTQLGYIPSPLANKGASKVYTKWKGEWEEYELSELFHTINHCKKRGVELVIVTSPYFADNDETVYKKSKEFKDMLDEMDVKYINLLFAYPFDTDSTLYRDAAHLNIQGAEVFTDTIVKSIKSFI